MSLFSPSCRRNETLGREEHGFGISSLLKDRSEDVLAIGSRALVSVPYSFFCIRPTSISYIGDLRHRWEDLRDLLSLDRHWNVGPTLHSQSSRNLSDFRDPSLWFYGENQQSILSNSLLLLSLHLRRNLSLFSMSSCSRRCVYCTLYRSVWLCKPLRISTEVRIIKQTQVSL
ncbi:hypothetical protein BT69DRAFT_857702 [Atractiella rhizophila]|nr:hypothetical protein BT69DRAFT_857702 [Atractiella rhizophila]